jgi:hypothetical protein
LNARLLLFFPRKFCALFPLTFANLSYFGLSR